MVILIPILNFKNYLIPMIIITIIIILNFRRRVFIVLGIGCCLAMSSFLNCFAKIFSPFIGILYYLHLILLLLPLHLPLLRFRLYFLSYFFINFLIYYLILVLALLRDLIFFFYAVITRLGVTFLLLVGLHFSSCSLDFVMLIISKLTHFICKLATIISYLLDLFIRFY